MAADPVIEALAATLPSWLVFPKVAATLISGLAMPTDSDWQRSGLQVEIFSAGMSAKIRETPPNRLPRLCPELHLNNDRSFCLGLAAWPIKSLSDARQWWADVEVHLKLLSVALATGSWPRHSELDHGDAGIFHQAARRLAKSLSLEEEYARAEAGEDSWISDIEGSIIDDFGRRLKTDNPCPCGCKQTDGRPFSLQRCPRRRSVTRLILLERGRRLELQQFWEEAKRRGQACCGKIRSCPLRAGDIVAADMQRLMRTRKLLGWNHSPI